MKKICLPLTARPHLARQSLLISELQKRFDLDIWQPKEHKGNMSVSAILYAIEFNNYLVGKNYDCIVLRGDRYEVLGLAVMGAYKGFKIAHIEGGDISGDVVDSKVRHAITHLSDYHFCTNKESHRRLINMGALVDNVWDFGSLDVEFAAKVKPRKLRAKPYILVAHHGIENEDETELDKALNHQKYDIIRVGGNNDYNKEYAAEEFAPEDYINLLRYAKCAVGNSSSLLKEASILGTPIVLVGNRQQNRLMPSNVVQVPCKADKIKLAIQFQMQNKHDKDLTYYKKDTSKMITKTLKEVL